MWVFGAEFEERGEFDDPSEAHDNIDYEGLGLRVIDDVSDVEHLDHHLGADGDRDASRGGLSDDFGRDDHHGGVAGFRLGQRARLGRLGWEPGRLQR
ncbi:MAG TPA: hypothetical protein VIJ56_06465 [Acidimicrobiales bacterium]